jgi:hypothetical protein
MATMRIGRLQGIAFIALGVMFFYMPDHSPGSHMWRIIAAVAFVLAGALRIRSTYGTRPPVA